jgi:hypothetical protein
MFRIALVVLLLVAAIASAQNVSCLLSGTLHDPSGAVIPGAVVKITAELTGFVRTTRTNSEGFFSVPDLTPATFSVSISAPGFKTYNQSGVEINSSEQRSLGVVVLQVGAAGDSVTVTAEASQLMTASGERAAVLADKDLSVLATRGRDLMDAVALLPGVTDLNESRESSSSTSASSVYILGGRDNQKNVTVDGMTNIEFGSGSSIRAMPSMESVSELKVLMSNYAAEHGRNSGGTITILTKGGGQKLRATAGFYHRHEQFAANSYFNNRNGVGKSPYRYKIFDYTLSGPVYIPGKFNRDRSKLFFFFSQELQRQLVAVTSRTVTVPTALERSGNFTQSFDLNGKMRTIYDAQANQTPFPGNVIPASRFSRIGQSVLNLFPLPNFVDPSPARRYQWNYLSAFSFPNPRHSENVRLDYSPRQNVQVFGRYTQYWNYDSCYYGGLGASGSTNFPWTEFVDTRKGQSLALHGTVTLSPSLFAETAFGWTRYGMRYYPTEIEKVTRKGSGVDVASWYPQSEPKGLLPNMSFGGVNSPALASMDARISGYIDALVMNPTYSFVENVSKIYRAHTLKFGLYVERASAKVLASNDVRGTLSFTVDRTNPLDSNYAYANALTGVYQSYQQSSVQPQADLWYRTIDWYAQDDWRVSPRLFLNYGVRFSSSLPMRDDKPQQSAFIPSVWSAANAPVLLRPALEGGVKVAVDPRTGAKYASVLVGTFAPGVGDPANGMVARGTNGLSQSFYTVPAVLAAPRLGFSWDPIGSGRTVLRGGAGVFYNRPDMGSVIQPAIGNPPTVYTPTAYHGTLETLGQLAGKGILAPTATLYTMFGSQKPEASYNFSFGVQERIGSQFVMDISYVGSLARHLWSVRNINPVPMGAQFLDQHPENRDPSTTSSVLANNFLRPYQGWGDILMVDFGINSSYNSLQANLTRRFRKGLMAASYTFSKALGTASTNTEAMSPFFDRRWRNYGPLSFDRSQTLSLRFNHRLPEPGRYFRKAALGVLTDHWEISGVARFMTGAPFTPGFTTVDSANITGTPSESARPDVKNPSAPPAERFGRPARGTFGNAGTRVLRGPGVNNWDLSLYRRIPIREGKFIQLRIESYNTFNHTQFSSVSSNARFDTLGNQVDTLFLEPTAARSARRLQGAIRLNW